MLFPVWIIPYCFENRFWNLWLEWKMFCKRFFIQGQEIKEITSFSILIIPLRSEKRKKNSILSILQHHFTYFNFMFCWLERWGELTKYISTHCNTVVLYVICNINHHLILQGKDIATEYFATLAHILANHRRLRFPHLEEVVG